MARTVRCALVGLGNVGRNLLHIFEIKAERLRAQYGLDFVPVAAADSSGIALAPAGFDPAALRRHKESGGRLASLPEYQAGHTPESIPDLVACDLLFEASPVNLQHGEPGLSATRAALHRGLPVVLANKAPLVLAYEELHSLAAAHGAALAFSATVCGALPVINIGRRDLIAADISLLRGIFNSTSNFILAQMGDGRSYAEALAEAQRRGIAEADPSLDVDGWDTANKLVIIANSVLGARAHLRDVRVQGISAVTAVQIQTESAAGGAIKLIATARRTAAGGYELSVQPEIISRSSFLGQCDGWEMGIEIQSDLYGKMYHKIWEREPLPTASAMLRDAVNLLTARAT